MFLSSYNATASLAQVIKEVGCHTHSGSSWCLTSCQCHVSHAQMHGDFKGPNPDQESDLVILFSGSGHAHSVWAFRHSLRHGGRAGQDQSTQNQRNHQVTDEHNHIIIIRRDKEVHMELSSQRRCRCQYGWSRSSCTTRTSANFT